MDRKACASCHRGAKSFYACSLCKQDVCSKCFLDNLNMCKVCLGMKRKVL